MKWNETKSTFCDSDKSIYTSVTWSSMRTEVYKQYSANIYIKQNSS